MEESVHVILLPASVDRSELSHAIGDNPCRLIVVLRPSFYPCLDRLAILAFRAFCISILLDSRR